MLTPEQKEEQRRIIAEQNQILAGAPSFAVKRMAQKAKLEALKKLGLVPKADGGPAQIGRGCFLHYWGAGSEKDLAQAVKAALDTQEPQG